MNFINECINKWLAQFTSSEEIKIAIGARLFAKWYMDVDSCHICWFTFIETWYVCSYHEKEFISWLIAMQSTVWSETGITMLLGLFCQFTKTWYVCSIHEKDFSHG